MLHRVSIENGTSYIFDRILSNPRILRILGLEYIRVLNIPKLRRALREPYLKIHGYFERFEF